MVLWTIRMKIIYKPINNDKVSQKRTLGTEHLLWRASTFVQVGGGGGDATCAKPEGSACTVELDPYLCNRWRGGVIQLVATPNSAYLYTYFEKLNISHHGPSL